jgi:uncharacterized protein YneF (UPF0154 family)
VISAAIRVSMPAIEFVLIVGAAFVFGFFAGIWVRRQP